jgi:hypothetical protein
VLRRPKDETAAAEDICAACGAEAGPFFVRHDGRHCPLCDECAERLLIAGETKASLMDRKKA